MRWPRRKKRQDIEVQNTVTVRRQQGGVAAAAGQQADIEFNKRRAEELRRKAKKKAE